jgi:hypothetical protein
MRAAQQEREIQTGNWPGSMLVPKTQIHQNKRNAAIKPRTSNTNIMNSMKLQLYKLRALPNGTKHKSPGMKMATPTQSTTASNRSPNKHGCAHTIKQNYTCKQLIHTGAGACRQAPTQASHIRAKAAKPQHSPTHTCGTTVHNHAKQAHATILTSATALRCGGAKIIHENTISRNHTRQPHSAASATQ